MRKKSLSKAPSPSEETIETSAVVEEAATVEESKVKVGAVSRAVYKAFYAASYGVVFGSLLVGKLIPKNGVIETALHDGATAAHEAFEELEKERLSKVEEALEPVAEEQATFEEGEPVLS